MIDADSGGSGFTAATQITDGIERVTVTPAERRHDTPILFLHGMWHGAWMWCEWQERLAAEGWESHAINLPGHGGSPAQGSVRFATMGKYLKVLAREIDRLPAKPVLIGHSMGGALAQWYLKKVGDDLPAVVLVASWTAHSTWLDGTRLHLKRDPWGFLAVGFTLSTDPLIRTPNHAASMLLGPNATISPEDLHAKLCPESALVLNQHNPPLWRPKRSPRTPMLWLASEFDAVISVHGARRSAAFYGADFEVIRGAGHNSMMAASSDVTVSTIDTWLSARGF